MTQIFARLMTEAHAERVVLAFHLALTAVVFAFMWVQVLAK